jgi:hypothetical protein
MSPAFQGWFGSEGVPSARTGARGALFLSGWSRPGRQAMVGNVLHQRQIYPPAWSPPAEVRRDKPYLPHVIPGGSPGNPMGVAAMTLGGGE